MEKRVFLEQADRVQHPGTRKKKHVGHARVSLGWRCVCVCAPMHPPLQHINVEGNLSCRKNCCTGDVLSAKPLLNVILNLHVIYLKFVNVVLFNIPEFFFFF